MTLQREMVSDVLNARKYCYTISSMYLQCWTTTMAKLIIPVVYSVQPRNYSSYRNGNSANFFSYVCNGKKFKELFASTLNGVTASVRYVSSMIVVPNGKLTRLIVAHANKEARQECRVLLIKTHRWLTSIAVLTVHAKASLLCIFQRSMQANKNINLW